MECSAGAASRAGDRCGLLRNDLVNRGLLTTDRIHQGESAIVSILGFLESTIAVVVLRSTAGIGEFATRDEAPTPERESLRSRGERSNVGRSVRLVSDAR